jgi:hypothetical protein
MPRTLQRQGFPPSSHPRRRSQAKLRLNLKRSTKLPRTFQHCLSGLPELTGSPIHIRFESQLTAHRGKLLCNQAERGIAVYAASFLRKREVVVDSELVKQPRALRLIVVHELFHFVWMRLGNKRRSEFSELLSQECIHRAKGELGESAAVRKSLLEDRDRLTNSRQWRDYVCESFCDTAAWHHSAIKRNSAFTLAAGWRKQRELWFKATFASCPKC